MMQQIRPAAAALLAVALTAAACGGSPENFLSPTDAPAATESPTTAAPATTAVPTITVVAQPVTAEMLNGERCGNWTDFGTVAALREVVAEAAVAGFEWRATRDLNLDGYPCEDQLGAGYISAVAPAATDEEPEVSTATEVPPATTTTAAPTTTTAAPTTTEPPTPRLESGVYEVGVDIEPGLLRFQSFDSCYWERLSGFGGSFDEIITNGNHHYGVVEILESDAGFSISSCDALVGGLDSPVATSEDLSWFMPGSYIFEVGDDSLVPGRYKLSGSCYWARLAGFSGDFDDLIANNNVDGDFIVDIQPSDAGFELVCR